jgi:hypothetical protein
MERIPASGGEILYNAERSLMSRFLPILMIMLVMTLAVSASESDAFGPQTAGGEPLWRFISASDAVSSNLSKIEMALVDASLALSETGIDGPGARVILSNLTASDSAVVDCITIDPNGTVREVEPAEFDMVKGMNLLWQEQVNYTINTRLWSGFTFIKSVEGMYAIDSEMPVFDRRGSFIGTVSFMFNASQLFGRVLAPFQAGDSSKIWVMAAEDATVLYETDGSQISSNRSSSVYQSYPAILALMERMSAERTGYGTYDFLGQSHMETIRKGCYWTTIPNKGTEMRLVLTLNLDAS